MDVWFYGLLRMVDFVLLTAHTHTHTKKELLIQLGATFQKTKNAVPLRKHHKSMHKQSDLILTAILVQELCSACSSPHHLFTGDTRVTWELFDI